MGMGFAVSEEEKFKEFSGGTTDAVVLCDAA